MNLSVRLRNDLNCGMWDSGYNRQLESQSRVDVVKGDSLETSSIRVLVVEDSEEFRKFICSMLGERPELQIVGEDTDGLQALQRADELQPDLILLDIGLPSLNGIEVARQIRKLSPKSKILFVSQESSADVVREALGTGRTWATSSRLDAGSELLTGVSAVLRGDQFVSKRFSGEDFVVGSHAGVSEASANRRSVARNPSKIWRSLAATRLNSILMMQLL